jgi:hypothetical protein
MVKVRADFGAGSPERLLRWVFVQPPIDFIHCISEAEPRSWAVSLMTFDLGSTYIRDKRDVVLGLPILI